MKKQIELDSLEIILNNFINKLGNVRLYSIAGPSDELQNSHNWLEFKRDVKNSFNDLDIKGCKDLDFITLSDFFEEVVDRFENNITLTFDT